MKKGFKLNIDADEVVEEIEQKKPNFEVFKAESGKKLDRESVLNSVDPEVATKLSSNAVQNKGRVGAKEKLWGKQSQINWKTFEAQKKCVDELVAKTGLKKADVFNAALALAMKYHESGADLKDIELNFTKE